MTDADISPNGAPFTFDILSGKNPAFRVDSDGTVKTASLLKSKIQEVYHMKVRVFDNGKPTLTSDTNLTIKVRFMNLCTGGKKMVFVPNFWVYRCDRKKKTPQFE